MKLNLDLQPEDVLPSLTATTKDEALKEMALKVEERHSGTNAAEILKVLQERERLGSTGIGDGIAIPHGKVRNFQETILLFARSPEGIDFSALDGKPVHLLFLLIAPEEAAGIHLKMLARISRLLKDPVIRRRLLEAPDADAIFKIIHEQDNR